MEFLELIFVLSTAGLLAAAVFLYRALFPKPIPGIPYRKESAKRLLGDIPEVIHCFNQWEETTKADITGSFSDTIKKLRRFGVMLGSKFSISTHQSFKCSCVRLGSLG